MTDEVFELADVQVSTLGLVTEGANKEEFFLLKSASQGEGAEPASDALPPAEHLSDDHVEAVTKGVIAKLVDLITGKKDSGVEVAEPASTIEKETTESIPPNHEVEPEVETLEASAVESEESSVSIQTDKGVVSMSDENAAVMDTRVADLEKALKDQATRESELVARLEKAEKDAAQERELRERQVYIAKAVSIGNFPVPSEELGEQLYWLAKQDPPREQFWTDLLKAVQTIMDDAALYVEKGNALPEADPIQAAVEKAGGDLKSALANISPQQAEQYIRSMRRRIADDAR